MPSYHRGRWRARVKYQGLDVYLGTFRTQREAQQRQDEFWASRGGKNTATEEAIKLIGRENVLLLKKHNIKLRRIS